MAPGRIILFDMPKKTFTLSNEVISILSELRTRLEVSSQTATVEIALRHLHRTLELDEPVYFGRSGAKRPPKSA